MQVFFGDKDPVSEAVALSEFLLQLLAEQPAQVIRAATATLKRGSDDSLRTINVTLVDEVEK